MTYRNSEPKEHFNPPTRRRAVAPPVPEATTIYVAGATHTPLRKRASAAIGLFIETEDNRNKGRCVPISGEQSQYVAELFAALEAIKIASGESDLTIVSTQSYVRDAMNKKLPGWEHEGWVGVRHHEVLRCMVAELKAQQAKTIFKVAAPGSPERALCRRAALLARRAARA
jgi:ribonuclease HI